MATALAAWGVLFLKKEEPALVELTPQPVGTLQESRALLSSLAGTNITEGGLLSGHTAVGRSAGGCGLGPSSMGTAYPSNPVWSVLGREDRSGMEGTVIMEHCQNVTLIKSVGRVFMMSQEVLLTAA